MKRFDDAMIADALRQTGQRTRAAAQLLGCCHVTVWQYRKRRGDFSDWVRPEVRFTDDAILATVDRARGDLKAAAAEIGCCVATVKRALPPLARTQRIPDAVFIAAVAEFQKLTAVAWHLGVRENNVRVRLKRLRAQQQVAA